jgi:hypothetical protein
MAGEADTVQTCVVGLARNGLRLESKNCLAPRDFRKRHPFATPRRTSQATLPALEVVAAGLAVAAMVVVMGTAILPRAKQSV